MELDRVLLISCVERYRRFKIQANKNPKDASLNSQAEAEYKLFCEIANRNGIEPIDAWVKLFNGESPWNDAGGSK